MKTAKSEETRKEYRREDLGFGVRGKHLEEFRKGTNMAAAFPDEDSVNKALRGLIKVAQQSIGKTKRSLPRVKARG
jgi:hypothetical protein